MIDFEKKETKSTTFVNTRILDYPLTGVQRYTLEILARLGPNIGRVAPSKMLEGVRGHLWEQTVLPLYVNKHLLWSPSNTGPLLHHRQIVTIHDLVPLDHPEWLNYKFASWYRWLVPKLAQRVQHIIAISEFTKQRIVQHTKIHPEKISVIYNGVDSKIFFPRTSQEINQVKNILKIPTPYYILSLGSLEPRKNLHRLIKSWEKIYRSISKDICLVIAGGKGKSIVFKDLSFQNLPPRVYFTGHVNNEYLPALYSGALFFTYLSVYEGFGLPPLEAMACGTPSITGNVTSLPEVIGDAGIMINAFDIEQISSSIIHLLEDVSLRNILRQKGLERAKSFTWENTSKLTLKLLEYY